MGVDFSSKDAQYWLYGGMVRKSFHWSELQLQVILRAMYLVKKLTAVESVLLDFFRLSSPMKRKLPTSDFMIKSSCFNGCRTTSKPLEEIRTILLSLGSQLVLILSDPYLFFPHFSANLSKDRSPYSQLQGRSEASIPQGDH